MTTQQEQTMRERLTQMDILRGHIRVCQDNIEAYERVFKDTEISISNNIDKGTQSVFITGERKNEILSLLKEHQYKLIKKYEKEMETP